MLRVEDHILAYNGLLLQIGLRRRVVSLPQILHLRMSMNPGTLIGI